MEARLDGLIPQIGILVKRIFWILGLDLSLPKTQILALGSAGLFRASLPCGGNPRKLAKSGLLHESGQGVAARRFSRPNKET
jgi:hypothetical protein